jgi:hypothetical protein
MLTGEGVSGYSICAEDGPDADEYAVYAALFAEKGYDKEGAQLVLENGTVVNDTFSGHMDQTSIEKLFRMPPMKDAIDDFIKKNRKSSALTDQFKLKATIVLITNSDVKRMFHDSIEGGWDLFHTKYPNAISIHTLSRVGFNKDKTAALVYYTYSCGGLCGQGQYVLLGKHDGQWKIEKESMTWIS